LKIIITSDIHCGYSGRLNDILWSLGTMYKYATNNGIKEIIILGDLFHNREHISIDVLNAVFSFFESHCEVEWIAFPGNHDMFLKESWAINSLKPLKPYVNVINSISLFELYERRFIVIPFIYMEREYMEVLKFIESSYDEEDTILTHVGVCGAINNSCFMLKNWSVVNFNDVKFKRVFAGHYHIHQMINNKVCYPGSPLPFRFDDGMVKHGFVVFDVNDMSVEFVDIRLVGDKEGAPCDFITISDDSVSNVDPGMCRNNRLRVVLNREYSHNELAEIKSELMKLGAVSVTWMKNSTSLNDDRFSVNHHDVISDDMVFEKWLELVDVSQYDRELLCKLNKDIVEDAEDMFVRSMEEEHE